MAAKPPRVSVVIVTRDRASRLSAALEALRGQTLGPESFEVVVVDDASGDSTPELLREASEREGPPLQAIRHDQPAGAAVARNRGWRASRAPVVAFTDDDCVPDPDWLARGLSALDEREDRFVQGTTTPDPAELEDLGPFSYTYDIRWLAHEFPTCNIFYPRALLERLDGFDEQAFTGWGEDTDLAWRARETGAEPLYAPDVKVRHAVVRIGPLAFLRRCWSQGDAVWLLARHPGLRRARLRYRLFWNPWQAWLVLLLIGLALPWRPWSLAAKFLLARPYVKARLPHPRTGHPAPAVLLWFMLADAVELAGSVRGGVRYRTLVL